MTSQLREIKLEGNELQSYLETFNKDLEGSGSGQTITVIREDSANEQADDDDEGTYFVDQSGNYYYQATKDSEPVLTEPPDGENIQYIVEEDENPLIDHATTSAAADETELISEEVAPRSRKQKLALSKDETTEFESISIVQSENDEGEVRYVFVTAGEEADGDGIEEHVEGEDEDQKAYDFDEEAIETESDGNEDTKKKPVARTSTRKSQNTSQLHMCNYCNYTSPKRYLLSRHMKSHSEERPYKCSVCERGFKTLASQQNHVNTHTGVKPHNCKFCSSSFTTSGELARHTRYRHTHEKPHKCHECDYASVELSKLKRHIRCHTGERPYQCPHCTYASPDTFKLKRHLRIHTGEKPYECDVCQARFTQSNSLKAHKLIHSVGDKPVFHCELCPTTCGRKTDLRIHVQKLHTSDKPLKCKRCGNSFNDRYSYKIHTKTHEGEKCYKCDLCPYASISARHLESHMLVHTDQKPYQCKQCDQAFRQKQLLKRHINLYHDPEYIPPQPQEKTHICPTCNRQFRHKGNLIRHMAFHDPDSNLREHAMALKEGRQKRIQVIDGQQVEVFTGVDDEEYEGESDYEEYIDGDMDDEHDEQLVSPKIEKNDGIVAIGDDGQRYMVVEVINMDDEEHQESQDSQEQQPGGMEIEELLLPDGMDHDPISEPPTARKISGKQQAGKDMEDYFGFEDEDEHLEDEHEISKSTIQLLNFEE